MYGRIPQQGCVVYSFATMVMKPGTRWIPSAQSPSPAMQEASGQLRHGSAAFIERHSIFTLFNSGWLLSPSVYLCQGVGFDFSLRLLYTSHNRVLLFGISGVIRNQTGAAMLVLDALLLLALPLLLTLQTFVELPE